MKKENIDKRKILLNNYLNELLKLENDSINKELYEFLEIKNSKNSLFTTITN
jgi:hypothetical protein